MTSKTCKLMSGMIVAGLALASQNAFSSTTLKYQSAAYPAYESASISYSDGASGYPDFTNKGVGVGGFKMLNQTTNQSITAWCVDVFDWLNTSSSLSYSDGNKASINNFDKLQQLANQRYGDVNNRDTSAAFQLAVWEIVNEAPGSSSFNLGTGRFSATGNATAISLANQWLALNKTTGNGDYNIAYYVYGTMPNGVTQNLISMSPVPLPAAGLLMMSALGLGGLATRRRKSTKQ